MPIDETGSESTTVEEIPQAITDKFEEIFSNADAGDTESAVETPAMPARETARRAVVKQEQSAELREEGIEDVDGLTPEAETEPTGDEPVETPEAAQAAEDAPELDANLRFAAQQFGWTDTQIDKLYAADSELAEQTFTNFLNAFTNLSRQQGLVPPAGMQPPVPNPAQQAAQQQSKFLQIFGQLKAFTDQNGEELGGLVQALHDEVYQPLLQMRAEYMVQKQQAVAAEATTVTSALSEKFADFYGNSERLTLVQQQNRSLLWQTADQLRAGAYGQGREMSVKDAINRAHLILTADRRVAEGRQQVQKQVQKRSRQITARPTQRVNPKSAGVSKGNQAAVEAYARRAQELGIDVDGTYE